MQDGTSQNGLFSHALVLQPRWRTYMAIGAGARRPRWRTITHLLSRAWPLLLKRRTSSQFSEASSGPPSQTVDVFCMTYTLTFGHSLYIIEPLIFKFNHTHNGSKQYHISSPL